MDTSQPQLITRRRLIQVGIGSIGAMAMHSNPAMADSCVTCPRMTVWHLETNWAQPRGPNGKTRLVSRASRRAAQHRYALTNQDALDMNLHLCSWAPASATEVCRETFMGLWNELAYEWNSPWLGRSVRLFDIRHVTRVTDGEERLAHALLQGDLSSYHCTPSAAAGGAVASLPLTGLSVVGASAAGAGLVLTGLITLRINRHRGRHVAARG